MKHLETHSIHKLFSTGKSCLLRNELIVREYLFEKPSSFSNCVSASLKKLAFLITLPG